MESKQFDSLADLIQNGKPGDFVTEKQNKALRGNYTHIFREATDGPDGTIAALLDTVTTVFFTESRRGDTVRVYRTAFTAGGRAIKVGGRESWSLSKSSSTGLPERINHGEVARFSQKALDQNHATAVASYQNMVSMAVAA